MLYLLNEKNFNLLSEKDFNLLSKDEVMYNSLNCFLKENITIYDLYVFLGKIINERCEVLFITYLKYYDFLQDGLSVEEFERYVNKRSYCLLCVLKNIDEKFYIIYKR